METKKKRISIIGLGYIGLPTASLLATKGFEVVGVDVSQKVVDTINQGEIHIVEPDLDILVKSAVHSGNLSASLEPCVADVFIIAVPTPFKDGGPDHISGKKPDLSYIESATKKISPYIKSGDLVILESTSPVGTTDEVVAEILKQAGHAVGENVYISHCPERVLPGRILIELVENDRVVGGINEESTKVTVDFYERFVRGAVLPTTAKTAEMVKLTENSSRDVQIAFANELSMICDKCVQFVELVFSPLVAGFGYFGLQIRILRKKPCPEPAGKHGKLKLKFIKLSSNICLLFSKMLIP